MEDDFIENVENRFKEKTTKEATEELSRWHIEYYNSVLKKVKNEEIALRMANQFLDSMIRSFNNSGKE